MTKCNGDCFNCVHTDCINDTLTLADYKNSRELDNEIKVHNKLNKRPKTGVTLNANYYKDYNKQYYINNKQELNTKSKEYYKKNRDKILENVKKYQANLSDEEKEKIKEYKLEWQRNMRRLKREAKLRESEGITV